MARPEITLITPSLNYGRFLGECLASSTPESQPGVAIEHFVFDAGSSDDSAAIAAGFQHVEWMSEPDEGMSHAINKGFDRARGDWVMWLNADDRLRPGALAPFLARAVQSKADIVYGDFAFVDADGGFLRRVRSPRWSPFVHIHHQCLVPSTATLLRRATLLEAGHRLRQDFHYVMDGEFFARMHSLGHRFQHVRQVIADFRLHGDNASQRHLSRTRDLDTALKAERQHIESRAIRRAYGFTPFEDPYLNGLSDGLLWLAAKAWRQVRKWV